MKRLIVFILPLLYLFSLSACKQELSSKQEITVRCGRGLYGKVKNVTDEHCIITFNEEGYIISKEWKDKRNNRIDYKYISPTEYVDIDPSVCNDETWTHVISYIEDTLKVIYKHKEYEELEAEYVFDTQGRIINYNYADGMMPVCEEYVYNGNNKYPDSMQIAAYYEEGKDISNSSFTYLEIDQQGNWTKRKVNRTWNITKYIYDIDGDSEKESTITDPEFIETRTITYYN